METKDHLYLAKLITEVSDFGGRIKKSAFEYGCIYPDINPLTYIKGHTYAATASYVRNVLNSLYGRLKTPSDCFNFGRAMHFIGDYFTFPHTPFFKGNLSEHVSYEQRLHNYIESSKIGIINKYTNEFSSSGKCINLIEKMINKYAKAKKSTENDWKCISFVCSSISVSFTKPKILLSDPIL